VKVEIRDLTPEDGPGCDAVVLSLPAFFGHEGGRNDCAEAVRTQLGWVAHDDDAVIGFLTVAPSTDEALEVTWMAVMQGRRGQGIGKRLIERAVSHAEEAGVPALLVLTAGPSSPEPDADPKDNYDGTRAFYKRTGFVPVKELTPSGWDQPALFLVRAVRQPGS
jgi:GNAT superfamily N-acetyltransferase